MTQTGRQHSIRHLFLDTSVDQDLDVSSSTEKLSSLRGSSGAFEVLGIRAVSVGAISIPAYQRQEAPFR